MSKTSINYQLTDKQSVLDLLSSIIIAKGHSLSWYTSKKGRTWITLRGFNPVVYTTSVEYNDASKEVSLEQCFLVCMFAHYPKAAEIQPPINTWLVARGVLDLVAEATTWLHTVLHQLDAATGELAQQQPGNTSDASKAPDGDSES